MSLDLRISRPRPRKSRGHILWLLAAVLLSAGWLAWMQGWQPERALAQLSQDVLPNVSVDIPQIQQLQRLNPQPAAAAQPDTVVMVSSEIIEHPGSKAYTANLYQATGPDEIPWPNVAGRTQVQLYEVQSGDSLWSIASQFQLDIDSLRWANPELERNPDVLSVGAELRILPVQGAYHTVASRNETIEDIAALYGVAPDDITDYPPNAMFPPYDLAPGDGLIIPFGRKGVKLPKPAYSASAALAWPLVGAVSGTFDASHPALDIGAPYGSEVYAADSGTITYANWAYEGYGYTVIVDHGDGVETWYNHLKGALLPAGNVIERGTPIGEVGSTGHSTGPHVHFEVRVNGKRVDPMLYLPGTTPN